MLRTLGGILLLVSFSSSVTPQILSFPWSESFDSVEVPLLPADWSTSANRLSSGDFFSTRTSPRSAPQALQSTNSTIPQFLVSPRFDFSARSPESLQFHIARSSSHTSPLLVEASTDDGATFAVVLSDTLFNPGTTSYRHTSIVLPPSLAGQSSVRFRWRTVGGTGGSTGTLRIDDVSVTTFVHRDLSIERFVINPPFPTETDPLVFSFLIRNKGQIESTVFDLDVDIVRTGSTEKYHSSVTGYPVAPNDSTALTLSLGPLHRGIWHILAVINTPGDEVSDNDTLRGVIEIGPPRGAVLINEIMYAPAGDEPEWVEVVSTSPDSLDLRGWKISDSNVSGTAVISTAPWIVPPFGYALIAKDSALFSLRAVPEIPVRIVNFAALNNTTPDAVVLKDHRGVTMDSVRYAPEWGGRGGSSLERIDLLEPSVLQSNWGTSADSSGATPGRRNSIARLDFDLELVSATAEGITIVADVRNAGRAPSGPFQVELRTTEPTVNVFGLMTHPAGLLPGDLVSLRYEWTDAPAGKTRVEVSVRVVNDERPGNNVRMVSVAKGFRAGEMIINEIMYEPLSGQNEWIELFHRGESVLDLAGWTIADRPTFSGNQNFFPIAGTPHRVLPGEFVVIAAESTILTLFPSLLQAPHLFLLNRSGGLSLGNDGDDIILRDLTGGVIDSVRYVPQWHHPDVTDVRGRSLERISPAGDSNDPRNWSTSANAAGGSPGRRNSIAVERMASPATLSFSPNPFSPDGDGFEDFCLIQYRLPHQVALIRLRIFDRQGRLIVTLADGEPSGAQGERIWNGHDDVLRRARIGPYVVLLEALDRSGGVLATARGVLVVATRL